MGADNRDEARIRQVLSYLGAAEIASGVPGHEVERDVRAAGRALGHDRVQVQAGPTGVVVGLGAGAPATFETVEGGLRLDQAARANSIVDRVIEGRLGPDDALAELVQLRSIPHRSPVVGLYAGGLAVALGLAFILQPALSALVFAAACAPVVVTLMRLTAKGILPTVLLPLSATFVTGLAAFWAADQGWLTGPLRTVLPVVAVLLPGATLVTGIAELVSGAMTAGVARLGYGAAQLLMFTVGLVGAARLLDAPADRLATVRADEFGAWSLGVGLLLVTLGISLMEAVPARFIPWVLLVLGITLVTQLGLQAWLAATWAGGFGGAFVASLAAWALARTGPRVPRLVLFLPSFWLLVPGSLGLLSVAQLGSAPVLAADLTAVAGLMLAIALGMVLGTGGARLLTSVSARIRWR